MIGFVAMIGAGIGCGLYGAASPADLSKAAAPHRVLAQDRFTFLAYLVVALIGGFAIMVGVALSPDYIYGQPVGTTVKPVGFLTGLGVGAADATAVGLTFTFYQAAWGGFALSRWWLAITHQLPWRLISFLDDARDRGVLRQVGAVYQFRHADLQRRLASHRKRSTILPASSAARGPVRSLRRAAATLTTRFELSSRRLRRLRQLATRRWHA